MTPQIIVLLFSAGLLGGVLNAAAGGGAFLAFPALLFSSVPPVAANATSTVALWAGTTASAGAYRRKLKFSWRGAVPLIVTSMIGGLAGAFLLLQTPAHAFMGILPWLMLLATLLCATGKKIAGRFFGTLDHQPTTAQLVLACIFEFFAALYGGYFGGGVGIINLALLATLGMLSDINAMNAFRVMLGVVSNGVAVLAFVANGVVYWPQGVVTMIGAVIGGYFGAHYAMRVPPQWIRGFVILVGTGMTVYFFVKAY